MQDRLKVHITHNEDPVRRKRLLALIERLSPAPQQPTTTSAQLEESQPAEVKQEPQDGG